MHEGRQRLAGREASRVATAIGRAARHILSQQKDDGHWCAELEGDTILESEYALLLYFLGRDDDPKIPRLASYVRAQQLESGGWSNYPGGPAEVSVSAKAYFFLKLAGDNAASPHMRAARHTIRELGGLDACNSYTRILFAIFGQLGWQEAPAVPPEIVLLPGWFYFNIYEMSSWSRAIVVPLSIIWAKKPLRRLAPRHGLDELKVERESPAAPVEPRRRRLWGRFFLGVDRLLKAIERLRLTPLRGRAVNAAESWMRERLVDSDGLGAIFPPMVNTVMALVCLGASPDDDEVLAELAELERLEIAEGEALRLQPCFSPVWDTALAVNALVATGRAADDPALVRACEWLVDREIRRSGDWRRRTADCEPSGWCFEYANAFYPDCDDTAEVLKALAAVDAGSGESTRRRAAIERGCAWQRAMQSTNGGWGAFDKDCDKEILEFVPFADHNAMIDPPTVDLTARSIRALLATGSDIADPAIRRALAFLYSEQERDGSWYGRWGANYIYGTWLALSALREAGEDLRSHAVQGGVRWLLSVQNEDGGWGESLDSYDDPAVKGRGESTASQTAWALMGLLAAGGLGDAQASAAIRRGVVRLLTTQRPDGSWYDENWTGTGFPKVFYLRYHLYACYFPLEALARFRTAAATHDGPGLAA